MIDISGEVIKLGVYKLKNGDGVGLVLLEMLLIIGCKMGI
jgi:hypothetical protein